MTTSSIPALVNALQSIFTAEPTIKISFSPIILTNTIEKLLSAKEDIEFFLFEVIKEKEKNELIPPTIKVVLKINFYKNDCKITLILRKYSYFSCEENDLIEVKEEKDFYFTYTMKKE